MYLIPEFDDDSASLTCQKGLPHGYVSPCYRTKRFVPQSVPAKIPKSFLHYLPFDVNDPIYELNVVVAADGSKPLPYRHPLELRTAKLQNMLSLPIKWHLGGFSVVPYESLDGGGLDVLLKDIVTASAAAISCSNETSFVRQRPYNISGEFRRWIIDHADQGVEDFVENIKRMM
jgi:hypothetical protein